MTENESNLMIGCILVCAVGIFWFVMGFLAGWLLT